MGKGDMEGQQEMMDGEHAGEMGEHDKMMGEHGEAMDEHGAAMEKQHESMRDLQEEWLKAKAAMSGGDTAGAAAAASEMEKSAAIQDEFMLHRNAGNKEEFQRQAMEFRRMVMGFRTYAEKGDVKSLREVAPRIDEACNSCHGTFR
ncbi:MAG TPA: cytochrome c [Nitrospirota bacterium]|jgi:hypothetical protein